MNILENTDELVSVSAGCERRLAILVASPGPLLSDENDLHLQHAPTYQGPSGATPSRLRVSRLIRTAANFSHTCQTFKSEMNSIRSKLAAFSLEQGTEESPLDRRWSVPTFVPSRARLTAQDR